MATGASITKTQRLFTTINLLVILTVSVFAAAQIVDFVSRVEETKLRANAEETLNLQAEALTGLLDKYRLLPVLLGHQSDIPPLFNRPQTPQKLANAKRAALRVMGFSGATNVAMIYPDGEVLVSGRAIGNSNLARSSTMMSAALQGRLGREMRVLENGKRVYVFTSGVRNNEAIVGVVAIYVDLEELEANWSLIANPILASNDDGTIVISNQPNWRLASAFDLQLEGNMAAFEFHTPVLQVGTHQAQFLKMSRTMPLLGWKLSVLVESTPIQRAARFWGSFAVLVFAALAFIMQMLINRHYALVRQSRADRASSLRLERIVRDRTKQLSLTNRSLEHEIDVRRKADAQLRNAQKELIQTGKLAALGQMSTALSHEFNQPLSAVKSYAENALTYMQRGLDEEAGENIKHISELTDRMAEISRHLRNFARKPNSTYGSVLISRVIEDALKVLSSRIRGDKAKIAFVSPHDGVWVRGGHVRLQQVIVNLVMNALDAMDGVQFPEVEIAIEREGGKVKIMVRDGGAGIDPDKLHQIFDPFFTTKEVGKGMGLGLSISYNIVKDFGGQLLAQNCADGGAVFVISLNEGETTHKATE